MGYMRSTVITCLLARSHVGLGHLLYLVLEILYCVAFIHEKATIQNYRFNF